MSVFFVLGDGDGEDPRPAGERPQPPAPDPAGPPIRSVIGTRDGHRYGVAQSYEEACEMRGDGMSTELVQFLVPHDNGVVARLALECWQITSVHEYLTPTPDPRTR